MKTSRSNICEAQPTDDPDGDGEDNATELANGTNPPDPNSVLATVPMTPPTLLAALLTGVPSL